ncbi:hypothetical protein [Enterococcus raffinosus]|uniref:hypothetical protein n=1 Tax=Enterococcus raffinosus TaxID=71452 RepID=UPI0020A10B69|nr:hypothetical protein [Enterococcus raffinosus]
MSRLNHRRVSCCLAEGLQSWNFDRLPLNPGTVKRQIGQNCSEILENDLMTTKEWKDYSEEQVRFIQEDSGSAHLDEEPH